jgi:L-rhamnose mutarotase
MATSEAQAEWDEVMEPILLNDDDIWMDEVYRMK